MDVYHQAVGPIWRGHPQQNDNDHSVNTNLTNTKTKQNKEQTETSTKKLNIDPDDPLLRIPYPEDRDLGMWDIVNILQSFS